MFLNRHFRRREAALTRIGKHSGFPDGTIASNQGRKRSLSRSLISGPIAAGALAVGALSLPAVSHAQVVPGSAQCAVNGTTVTCTGDLSAGVDVDGPAYDTLNVNTVDAPGITPTAGIDGINFITTAAQNITINADTSGTTGIVTTGPSDNGIVASLFNNGNIAITHVGAIQAGDDGIEAFLVGNGTITIANTGNISANRSGIDSFVYGDGNITVTNMGNITTTSEDGIFAYVDNGDGNITVTNMGNITTTSEDGIFAYVDDGDGDISITSVGVIDAGDYGIYAYGDGVSNIAINHTGNIAAGGGGVYAGNDLGGDISIFVNGDITSVYAAVEGDVQYDGNLSIIINGNITSTTYRGIFAFADQDITVIARGDIQADNDAIGADSDYGSVNIIAEGSITSTIDEGIDADAYRDISIIARGGIQANLDGISAYSQYGSVSIMAEGNITSTTDNGIDAFAYQDITIIARGDIQSNDNGIDASSSNGSVSIVAEGNITATTRVGIDADAYQDITIIARGDIQTEGDDAIEANSVNGSLSILAEGTLTSVNDFAIDADAAQDISIVTRGDIQANSTAIIVNSTYGSASIVAEGNITSTTGYGVDVYSYQDISIVTRGDIQADDEAIDAYSQYGSVSITAEGNITSTSDNGIYVYSYQDISIVTRGDIQADNRGMFAFSRAGAITILSTGNITADYGILGSTYGSSVSITSLGNITSDLAGIAARAEIGTGSSVTIFNSGDITTTGTSFRSSAIYLFSRSGIVAPATITNAGTLTGGNGFAIDLANDGNDVVNLLPGSVINGAIDFGNGNDGMGGTNPADVDTLNFLPGLNATVNFADSGAFNQGDTDLQSAPENIVFAGGGAIINGGLTAVAVDSTGFTMQGTFISDLTDTIQNSIDNGGTAEGSGINPQTQQAFGPIGALGSDQGYRLWGSLFGGYHAVDGDGSSARFTHSFYGLMSGIESGDVETDGVYGLFGGYGDSTLSVDFNAGDTDIDSFFGGVYWKQDYGSHRIHASFTLGATDNETTRLVNGVEAEGDFDGVFYSPSLTVSAPLDWFATPMFVSARATYTHMELDGYTETGIALPLTIGDRTVSVLNTRAQLNLPQFTDHPEGGETRFNWAIGLDATTDAGSDDVGAVVAATPFSFSAETEDEVAGFVGLNIAHTSQDGRRTLGFNGEVQSAGSGTVEVTGELTARFKF